MHARPNEASVGIDVDLGHAELRGRQILVFIYAARGRIQFATSGVDSLHLFDRHARTSVHDDWCPGNSFLDFLDDIEMKSLFTHELVGAMAGADRRGERIATGSPNEFDRFNGIRQGSMSFIDLYVLFDPAEPAELSLDTYPFFVSAVDDAFRDRNVVREGFVAGVDHH